MMRLERREKDDIEELLRLASCLEDLLLLEFILRAIIDPELFRVLYSPEVL